MTRYPEKIILNFLTCSSLLLIHYSSGIFILIGIAAIIAIVSTIKGTNEQIEQNLIGAGDNNVTVQLYQGDTIAIIAAIPK